jgi:hypothetical protein
MIDLERVNETLCAIAHLSPEEADGYAVIVQNSVAAVDSTLVNPHFADDERIIFLAAARANYYISLLGAEAGSVREFSAGDVKVSLSAENESSALTLFRSATDACAGMVTDDGFVFRGV